MIYIIIIIQECGVNCEMCIAQPRFKASKFVRENKSTTNPQHDTNIKY